MAESAKLILIKSESDKTLHQHGGTKWNFSRQFNALVEQYGFGDRSKLKKRKNHLGKEIGVGGVQITRYQEGGQLPSLETFVKICLNFQLDPSQALGLQWKDSRKDKDATVTNWEVKDDLRMGGFRLYWTCDKCSHKNIEYLDRDFAILENIEGDKRKLDYESKKKIEYAGVLKELGMMCEKCSVCYIELKGMEVWAQKNT